MGQNKITEVENDNLPQEMEEKTQKETKAVEKKVKLRSNTYQKKAAVLNKDSYTLAEALELLEKISYTKFDPAVEVHFNLSIDPKKSDQLIRQNVVLPHGIKKDLKILVFGNEAELKEAKQAGATYLGDDEMIAKVKDGWVDFDKVITSPAMMPKIAILARVLGPKRLMPSTKNNTITTDIKTTLTELLSGTTIEIRNEKDFPLIHTKIGKLSFNKKQLEENFRTTYEALIKAKPPKVKLPFIKAVTIKTTMSPGIKIDIKSLE